MHAEARPDIDRPVVHRLNRPQAALREFILDPERVNPSPVAEPTSRSPRALPRVPLEQCPLTFLPMAPLLG